MLPRFIRTYATFEEWSTARPYRSPYVARRIERTHARYPSATLGQLRRHLGSGRSPLSGVPRAPPSRPPASERVARSTEGAERAVDLLRLEERGEESPLGLQAVVHQRGTGEAQLPGQGAGADPTGAT